MTIYEINFDKQYITEATKKYRASNSTKWLRITLKFICFIGLGLLLALAIWKSIHLLGIIAVFIILLLVAGPYLDFWYARNKLKKHPHYGNNVNISLTLESVHIKTDISDTTLTWDAFSKFIKLKLGFLLFVSNDEYFWLPNSCLVSGSVDEVDELISANLT